MAARNTACDLGEVGKVGEVEPPHAHLVACGARCGGK